MQPTVNYLLWLQYIVYGSVLLYFGRAVFIPISFALLISFVLYPVCAWLEKKGTGRLFSIVIALVLLIAFIALVVILLVYQFVSFLDEWPSLQEKLKQSVENMSQFLIDVFSISKDQQRAFLSKITEQSGGNFLNMVKNAVSASAVSVVLFILVPVYTALILYYRNYWMKVLFELFPSEDKNSLRQIILMTIQTYYNFIKGMVVVYLIVGVLNSIGLLLLGIPHAILFGFIASILTFIPYIGIIVGSLLPITMAWITYNSIWYPAGIVAIFAFVQYLEANVIFPITVSSRLNVNALVMLIAIFAGNIVWGLPGMILFVPFVGIAKIIADHNPGWRVASMILSNRNNNTG